MATRIGLEPTTPSVTGWCSNQLSYRAMIAQVRGCSPPERALLYPKNDFLSSRNLQKPQKTFREKRKGRPQAENGQNKTSGTIAPDVCGRGSKSRTHGTRFWRPLLYQLSYTPRSVLHFLNACLLYKIQRKMSSTFFNFLNCSRSSRRWQRAGSGPAVPALRCRYTG